MRKLIFIFVVLIAGLAALRFVQGSVVDSKSENPTWPTVKTIRETMIESTVATGTVKSKVGAEVKVGSQISGVVSKLYVNVGDKVRKGDLLATLDDAMLRARQNTLKAELDADMAEQKYAQGELQRYVRLGGMVSGSQLDNSKRNVAVREATIDQTKAKLADASIQLGYVRIVAPIGGTIASVSTYEGETVAANFAAPTFVTIVDLDRLEIQAYVDETDIGKIQIGQSAKFRIDAYSGKELDGTVRAIYPKPQIINNVVNYVVIIDILDKQGLLVRPEMTAHVSFILDKKEAALSVPRSAVLREGANSFVLVRSANGWVKKQVKTGLHTPQRLEIVSDLRDGDTILSDAQLWKDQKEKSL